MKVSDDDQPLLCSVMNWVGVFVLILIDIKLWPQIFHVQEKTTAGGSYSSGSGFFIQQRIKSIGIRRGIGGGG